jgi:hypothetical protein
MIGGESPLLQNDVEGAMVDTNIVANNGVNVEALIAARDALAKSPEGAQFKWRAAHGKTARTVTRRSKAFTG